ncbi:unnamed protein product [Caenorhabditis auriculariae]|uniref:Uncharacterized protein n=1 Tax=Caenorhabditis auriculariae TaxID=2777116 RepID=A0A8S1GVY6_9PELO|nr:unnamed protein product [Caenorhabditis auriculariae]
MLVSAVLCFLQLMRQSGKPGPAQASLVGMAIGWWAESTSLLNIHYIPSSSRRNWMDYAQKDKTKDRKNMLSTLSTTRLIISFHHVDWSVSLPLSHGIIFRRPSALDKLGAVLFPHGEAVFSLVLPTGQHYFPTLAVTPGRIGQRLWTVTRADD